jgi:hypothetical protein
MGFPGAKQASASSVNLKNRRLSRETQRAGPLQSDPALDPPACAGEVRASQ